MLLKPKHPLLLPPVANSRREIIFYLSITDLETVNLFYPNEPFPQDYYSMSAHSMTAISLIIGL